jgi:hypothetical protein
MISRHFYGLILVFAALFVLYQVKLQAQAMENTLADIEREIAEEEEMMHILKAEWAYLTRPQRLSELMVDMQQMTPASVDKIVTVSAIPYPPPPPENAPLTDAAPMGAAPATPALQVGYER